MSLSTLKDRVNIFDKTTLQQTIESTDASVSILLRIIALIALNKKERDDPTTCPEILKLLPKNDCLFPFYNTKDNKFFFLRTPDLYDLNIVKNELNISKIKTTTGSTVSYTDVTIDHFKQFLNGTAITFTDSTDTTVLVTKPEFNNEFNPAIIFADHNDTILRVSTNESSNKRVNDPNSSMANLNFFDEVNAVHNTQKSLGRYNKLWTFNVRDGKGKEKVGGEVTFTLPNSGLALKITMGKNGSYGRTLVENWGAYDGEVRETVALQNLREKFLDTRNFVVLTDDGKILKDLYRLECIREPAALITNAMFLNLATSTYDGLAKNFLYKNITELMPMATQGPVNVCKCLWRSIQNLLSYLYYRYDYEAYATVKYDKGETKKPHITISNFIKLENNLLFNYIMYQADKLYNVGRASVGGGNITARLITDVLTAATVANQQLAFAGGVNPWVLVAGTSATGVAGGGAPVPALGGLPAGVVSIYQVSVPVTIAENPYNIVFQARFPIGGAPIQATDIFITSFPLALINNLLNEWYQVDIGLPNQNIQIDLQLRA